MKALYGLYPDPYTAQRAVERLREAGIAERDITIVSSEPIDDNALGSRDKGTWLPWIAAVGGVIGLLFGTWLTTHTQTAWPIVTGGMPIVAWWPNLIVMFEMTMLGAILATVIGLCITAAIPFGAARLYDVEISDGKILVGVENPRVAGQDVERALNDAGPGRVKAL